MKKSIKKPIKKLMKKSTMKKPIKKSMKNTMKKSMKQTRLIKKGGAPGEIKFNFAYIYHIVTHQDLMNLAEPFRSNFNAYIRRKDDECNCISLNTNPCNYTDATIPIINENQELIIFLKYDDIAKIETFTNFDNILGHAILDYTLLQTRNIIGIFNVCLENTAKRGYGSVIFNLILTYLELKIPLELNPILWLGILVDNVEFNKVSYIYTSAGFELPFITFKYPFGNFPIEIISLIKNLRKFIVDELTSVISYHKTLSMRNQYLLKKNTPDFRYIFSFKYDKSFIVKARLLPYLDVTGQMTGLSSDPTIGLFREFSGSLKIYNSELTDSDIIYKLSFDTMENSQIDMTVGEQLKVNINPNSFTYHTHPIGGYRYLNVLIAPPSGPDFLYFLIRSFNLDQLYPPAQSHTVITLEGIYILSLHSNAIKNYNQIKQHILQNLSNESQFRDYINQTYDYPVGNRAFDWTVGLLGDDKTIIIQSIQRYIDWFNIQNKLFLNGMELFNNQFISWSQLDKNKLFQINIPSIYGSCIVPSSEYKVISDLLGPQYNDFNILPIPS